MRDAVIGKRFAVAQTKAGEQAKAKETTIWSVMHYFAAPLALTAVWGLSFVIAWDRFLP